MLRGVNQQQIFEDQEDCDKFLQVLKECREICGFGLYAYCLMGNHIHLLMQEVNTPIESCMKRIATRFVYWYNIKYQRTGHLFQDRFKSEPVEDDAYFLTVLRYIHQNPVKAGLCDKVEEYRNSSFNEFFKDCGMTDNSFVFELISKKDFGSFNNKKASDSCMDIAEKTAERVTLLRLLDTGNPMEKNVIVCRYFRDKTQSETARLLGLSQVQVSRMEKRAIARLRNLMDSGTTV